MKKLIFTFISCMIISCAFSQITYYYVGGAAGSFTAVANYNTALDGSGATRVAAANDILIFDGSNIGGATPTPGVPLSFAISTVTIGRLQLQNGADISLSRSGSGGTTNLNIGDIAGDDLIVNAGCKLRLKGNTGSILLLLVNNAANPVPATTSATAKIYGDFSIEDGNGTIQNRITSRLKGAFVFASGSSFTTLPAYAYYPFSSTGSSTTPVNGGIVFEAGSSYYFQGGLSPFGSNSTSFLAEFQTGSNFYFRTAAAPVMFNGRSYGNVFIESNVTADGPLNRINNFTISPGAVFITHVSGTTPITGNIVNNGSFLEPAADPNRNNKIVMAGDAPQTIGGTGVFALADFIVSNASSVTLLSPVQVDSATVIYGALAQSPSATITGGGSTTIKTPASVTLTGALTADNETISSPSSLSGVEIGMSVSGTGIPANTVVVNFSSTTSTITLSKVATATNAAASLLVFNGAGVVPVSFTDERAALSGGKANISWKMQTESDIINYVIERSASGTRFDEIGNSRAAGSIQYYYTDQSPLAGINYYRIKALEASGQIKYSNILKVVNEKGLAALQVYPNPVKDKIANVQLSNMEKGAYTISVFSQAGQKQFTKAIAHAGGSATFSVPLPATMKTGMYVIRLDGEGASLKQQLIVQ